MKKLLQDSPLLILLSGIVGVLLRVCLLIEGSDDRGLYPSGHFAWTVLILLSVAVVGFLFVVARSAEKNPLYQDNYPVSFLGAVGFLVAAAALAYNGFRNLTHTSDVLCMLTGGVAMLSGVGLLLAGWCRLQGSKPHYVAFALPCLYFAIRLFSLGKTWGDEPETARFLMPFLATAAAVMAFYYLWGFAVDLGNRSASRFWSLSTVYFCMVSILNDGETLLHMAVALCLLTNLCPCDGGRVRKVEPAPAPKAEQPSKPQPQPQPKPKPATSDMDVDAIIEEFLRENP